MDKPVTIDKAYFLWIRDNRDAAGFRTTKSRMRWWVDWLSGLPLYNVDRFVILEGYEELRKKISKRTGKPLTKAGILGYVNALRTLMKTAVDYGLIEAVPKMPVISEGKLVKRCRWLTVEEAYRLRDALPDYLRLPFVFALNTGLRSSNVRSLQWDQIDMNRRICVIERTKNGNPIGIPLNDDAFGVLLEASEMYKAVGSPFVFLRPKKPNPFRKTPVPDKDKWSAFHKWTSPFLDTAWQETLQKCGIKDFWWHDIRHTWATWHVQAGTSLHDLQVLGGWSSYTMVTRYAHLAPDVMHDQVARLAERASAIQQPRTHQDSAGLSSR